MPEFIKPEISELSFLEKMLGNKNTMSWLGKTIAFPKDKWKSFYDSYVEADPDDKFFRLIWCGGCNDFVGIAGYEKEEEGGSYKLNLLIDSPRRYSGYGSWALRSLQKTARENGLPAFTARISKDNTAWKFLESCGFEREKEDADYYYEICRL